MKRILGMAAVAVLAAGLGLVAPAAASAAPSNVVTSSEFYKVGYGNSIAFVRSTFGSNGKVVDRRDDPGVINDVVTLEFPTYDHRGTVLVDFSRRSSGAWYLYSKYAYWGTDAVKTADKATESEFDRVEQGNSIAYARRTFGTAGTVIQYEDGPGTADDRVVVEWPTEFVDGLVQVRFTKSPSGVWKVHTRTAAWRFGPEQATDKATELEFDRVVAGNTLGYARETFGTPGSVVYQNDAPGTTDDQMAVEWPTESTDGSVSIAFVRGTRGVWKVSSRTAEWAVSARATEDLATRDEFDALGPGDTLDIARGTFGTSGTVVFYGDAAGTASDLLNVEWYTGSPDGNVLIGFRRSDAGVWAIAAVEDMAWPWRHPAS